MVNLDLLDGVYLRFRHLGKPPTTHEPLVPTKNLKLSRIFATLSQGYGHLGVDSFCENLQVNRTNFRHPTSWAEEKLMACKQHNLRSLSCQQILKLLKIFRCCQELDFEKEFIYNLYYMTTVYVPFFKLNCAVDESGCYVNIRMIMEFYSATMVCTANGASRSCVWRFI